MRNTYISTALALFAGLVLSSACALAQIQSTITCPDGYWDTLSIMAMDQGLNANYHLEGQKMDGSAAYKFTNWLQGKNEVQYLKTPTGYPWDIFLYDSNFVYHWITEVTWADPSNDYKINRNASGSNLSFPWISRCAIPAQSAFWVQPPGKNPTNNTGFYQYKSCQLDNSIPEPDNVGWAYMEVKATGTDTITDHRATPAQTSNVTTLPLQYTYNCSVEDTTKCTSREVFTFAVDATTNPVDHEKHSYGWIRWRHYTSSDGVNWTQDNWALTDQLEPNLSGQGQIDFGCSGVLP
jgi:hypothetical protein